LIVFAVSPWRALPESFFWGFAIIWKSPIALDLEPRFIDSLVTVRKQSSMPSHACDPGQQRERFPWQRRCHKDE